MKKPAYKPPVQRKINYIIHKVHGRCEVLSVYDSLNLGVRYHIRLPSGGDGTAFEKDVVKS